MLALPSSPTHYSPMTDSEAWNEYCEASLDLSNQDDVGERETAALAALNCLYTENADGMKRLADS